MSDCTFLASAADPHMEQRLWAAVLHCGPMAMLAGRAALVLAGWNGGHRLPLDVLVPAGQQERTAPVWLRVRRTRTIPAPLGSPARVSSHLATLQAAAWSQSDREAMFIVVSALQQGVSSASGLLRELEDLQRLPRRRTIREAVKEFCDGAQSVPEVDFARLCSRFSIPKPVRQVRRQDRQGRWRYTDAEFTSPTGTVIVEIDGLQHLDPRNWIDDIDRQNSLVLNSTVRVLRVASWTLRHEPEAFMRTLRDALGLCA